MTGAVAGALVGDAVLEVRDVTHRFGGLVANRDVCFDVGRGEILGLIGPNGAGKSTVFNLIAGAFPPSSGSIRFEGADVAALDGPARCRLGIARTFQVPRSFDSMTVEENVMVGALVRHPRTRDARDAARETLGFVGLAARGASSAADLTPPEKRRLEMARALVTRPRLLLLDEVMTGLTPAEARLGVELIRRVREGGTAVVMVEHVMQVVMSVVDRAVVLNLGEVLAAGPPGAVVRDPGVIAAYLGDRFRAA